jgi:hypothetical protein
VSTIKYFGNKNLINISLLDRGIVSLEAVKNQNLTLKRNSNPFNEIDLIFYSNSFSSQNVNYLGLDNQLNRSVDYQLRQSLSPENISEYLKDYNRKKESNILFVVESFNLNSIY